jgi:hypothetical protein
MASIFKARGASRYAILYVDENGRRRKKTGATDRTVTKRISNKLEDEVALRKAGLHDPKAEAYRDAEAKPLSDHFDAWRATLSAKDLTETHVRLHASRVARTVALSRGAKLEEIQAPSSAAQEAVKKAEAELRKSLEDAKLSDLTTEKMQAAMGRLRAEGRSLQTLNHHRAAIVQFARWCYDTDRVREKPLRKLDRYNHQEDRRPDRRTVSVEEMRRLILVAQNGEPFKSMTGPTRALLYRLAVSSGLRYRESDRSALSRSIGA